MFARVFIFCFLCGCAQDRLTPASGPIESHARIDHRKSARNRLLLFDQPLSSLYSREHFRIEAVFEGQAGRFVLHTNFNGFEWRDGMQVQFVREGRLLSLKWRGPDSADQTVNLPESWLAEDGRLSVRIEMHNSPVPRVLIWRNLADVRGIRDRNRAFVSVTNADFDSRLHFSSFLSRGRGVRWGLESDSVNFFVVRREAPYVP